MSRTDVLTRSRFMALATTCEDGQPWCVPITFAFHDDAIYWRSSEQTVHSKNIEHDDRISISIFDTAPHPENGAIEAFYLQSLAKKVSVDEQEGILAVIGDSFSIKDKDVPLYYAPIGNLDEAKSTDSRFYNEFSEKGEATV